MSRERESSFSTLRSVVRDLPRPLRHHCRRWQGQGGGRCGEVSDCEGGEEEGGRQAAEGRRGVRKGVMLMGRQATTMRPRERERAERVGKKKKERGDKKERELQSKRGKEERKKKERKN